MQALAGRAERSAGAQGLVAPKAVSPLQQEIDMLKESLETQRKTIEELRLRLAPVFQEVPVNEKTVVGDCPALSEMPTQVRDCKIRTDQNTTSLQWLVEHLEV